MPKKKLLKPREPKARGFFGQNHEGLGSEAEILPKSRPKRDEGGLKKSVAPKELQVPQPVVKHVPDINAMFRRPLSPGMQAIEAFTKPTADFTRALATEIVKNLTTIGQFTTRPFRREKSNGKGKKPDVLGENPVLVDTSILIDGRILPIVNSGFLTGTLIVPEFVLGEVQHIADSADSLRRAKGRRGLEVLGKIKTQKVNLSLKTKIITEDVPEIKEVDHKLITLAKRWNVKLLTVDFNLAQRARTQGVKVLNVNDLGQALKIAIIPGEEVTLKITHEGKERLQGVGYLTDGTMVVVDDARDKVGMEVSVIVTKIHQTAAGQLFFARLK